MLLNICLHELLDESETLVYIYVIVERLMRFLLVCVSLC